MQEGGGILFVSQKKKKKWSFRILGTMLDKHLDEAQGMIEYQREL